LWLVIGSASHTSSQLCCTLSGNRETTVVQSLILVTLSQIKYQILSIATEKQAGGGDSDIAVNRV
jgi:hypothetical protein